MDREGKAEWTAVAAIPDISRIKVLIRGADCGSMAWSALGGQTRLDTSRAFEPE